MIVSTSASRMKLMRSPPDWARAGFGRARPTTRTEQRIRQKMRMQTRRVAKRRPTIVPSRRARQSAALLAALLLVGCARATGSGSAGDFNGFVVADEPRAALVGRDILKQGGNAADAAVAARLAMTVTLPSRGGLGGGGACVARNGREPTPTGGLIIGGARRPQQLQEVKTRS